MDVCCFAIQLGNKVHVHYYDSHIQKDNNVIKMPLHIYKMFSIFMSLIGMASGHPMILYAWMYPSPKE